MDVLFLSHVGYFSGGAEKSLLELVKDCMRRRLKVHVLLPDKGEFYTILREAGVPCSIIAPAWWTLPVKSQERMHNANAIAHCTKLIQQLHPKVCVTNTAVTPPLAIASSLAGVPHFWMLREYGQSDHGFRFRMGDEKTYRLISLLSDKIFCNSKALKKFYTQRLRRQDIGVVYPYVAKPKGIKNPASSGGIPRLAIIGHVQEGKGQLDAVNAVALLKKQGLLVNLQIIGYVSSPKYYSRLKAAVKSLGISDAVEFLGQMSDPFGVASQADVGLVCSSNEAFGRTTLEFMYLGIPVVGSKSGGTAEIINDGKTGLLYASGNEADLANKIKKLLENKQLAQRLSRNAKAQVHKEFSINNAHKEFFESLDEYLAGKAKESLDLTIMNDLLELVSAKEKWWKNDRRMVKNELTKSHMIIQAMIEENIQREDDKLFRAYKMMRGKKTDTPKP